MAGDLAALIDRHLTRYPDFPQAGVVFRDINPILANPALFQKIIAEFSEQLESLNPTHIVGIESRGFIFGAALAHLCQKPFILARKAGKLPGKLEQIAYALEYGTATIEVQREAVKDCQSVVIVDDVIATGGTLLATTELMSRLNIEVKGILSLASIEFLQGRQKLEAQGLNVATLCPLK